MKYFFLMMAFIGAAKSAVSVNSGGLGEVLLLPYYSVNSGLNTMVNISNTTAQSKALKLVVRDGRDGVYGDSVNIYLAPYDVWNFVLTKNKQKIQLTSQDESCVPFFTSPKSIFADIGVSESVDRDVWFSEGTIEIYEMGELDPSYGFGEAVTFTDGQPKNCNQIEENWSAENGVWSKKSSDHQLLPAAGGLMAAASIINVSSGVSFSFDAIALNGFFADDLLIHTRPNNYKSPSLADADKISSVTNEGTHFLTQWSTGFESISAVLMKYQLFMDYSNDLDINAQTEVIMTLPTRNFHLADDAHNAPFNQPENLFTDCELYYSDAKDRDTASVDYVPGVVSPRPLYYCWNTHVLKVWDFYNGDSTYDPILFSNNRRSQSIIEGKSGLLNIAFNQFTANGTSLDGSQTHVYSGLPVISLYVIKYNNANANRGLSLQFSESYMTKNVKKIERIPK